MELCKELRYGYGDNGFRQEFGCKVCAAARAQACVDEKFELDPQSTAGGMEAKHFQQKHQRFTRRKTSTALLRAQPEPAFAAHGQVHKSPPWGHLTGHACRLIPQAIEQNNLHRGCLYSNGSWTTMWMKDPEFACGIDYCCCSQWLLRMPDVLPALGKEAMDQVAGTAGTSAFTWMTQQVDLQRAADVFMRRTNAPAGRHAAE
jgi:hypothetical protein